MIVGALLLASLALLLGVALWNAIAWPRVVPLRGEVPGSVSVLIPARDEEEHLPGCLDALLAGGGPIREILVYDDHSSDLTAAVVDRYAGIDPRVRLLLPSELPDGWYGKPFACSRLADAAACEWLLFLDADTRVAPGGVAGIVNEAHRRGVSFLSCWPRIEMASFAERLLMPLLNFVVFSLYPAPLASRRPDPSLGLAHGACILARRETYGRIGGHARVREQLFEDTQLARVWREAGERGLCLDGQDVVRVRMYRSFGAIWRGFQKNFYPAFDHAASFWLFMAAHATLFLAPFLAAPALAARGSRSASFWLAVGAVLAIRGTLAARFRHPILSVLLHPAGEAVLLARGLASWYRCVLGSGVEWKGRTYRSGPGARERFGG